MLRVSGFYVMNYLQYLHGLFGDWSLALAAYNWGEGNVGRAVNRARAQGLEPVYENLRMPNETRNYVPKLLAVRNIVNNPEYFGMSFADLDNKPFFKAVDIDQPIDLSAAVRLANISQAEFDALNPAFKSPVYIPKTGRKLLLPATAIATFERNYKKADRASLLSWDVYTPYADTTLSSIAAETGMSTAELKRLNGLSKESVAAGRSLLIAKNRFSGSPATAPANFAALDTDTNPNDSKLQTVPNLNIAVTETVFKPSRQTVDIQTASAAQPAPDTLRPPVQTAAVDFTKQTAQSAAPTVTNHPVAAAPAAPSTDEVEDRIRQLASASASQNAPQPATASVADGGNNELLMTFVQESGLSENSDTVTVADSSTIQLENEQAAQEAAERSRQAKLTAERAKQQKQAAEARALAAAKNSGTPTTHKVGTKIAIATRDHRANETTVVLIVQELNYLCGHRPRVLVANGRTPAVGGAHQNIRLVDFEGLARAAQRDARARKAQFLHEPVRIFRRGGKIHDQHRYWPPLLP